ncbi:alpha-amylase family glycosyl hydrolase [Euzebya rosea]|uniref:alpha-amylase family glycosyl hydrolase n=1 Tax=Euzebya rosea TaxID=2052804 RepID=UPI000D3E9967|nr:alpha-amylase family glycosyl hydrolase [Euzebya rosea]
MLDSALRTHLSALYPPDVAEVTLPRLMALAERHRRPREVRPLDQHDVWLIAYADHVGDGRRPPLQVMDELLSGPLADVVNGVHLLPFYPWTSDDGFAVVDFRAVDPAVGDWDDVVAVGRGRRLMVDAVVNHMSASSTHVRDWTGHVLSPHESFDTSEVVRPRTSPLLTPFEAPNGLVRHAWTTFSPDQVDLDYGNPDVLVDMTDVLLGYVERGASVIRLDAVAFLWKESGTPCIHLPQTHEVIRLWRTMLDWCAPGSMLITETNVPHEENISYFGDGSDEAHLVYQFALAPLVLASFMWGNAQDLTRWAASLEPPPGQGTFFNFLASHDGIGLRPAEGLVSSTQVDGLCALARAAGGGVSYRSGPNGRQLPYELNTTVLDALDAVADDGGTIQRIVAAHAILLALQGVPGMWAGSLLGVRNWTDGVQQTGRLRTVNRRRLLLDELMADLQRDGSFVSAVFHGLAELVALRTSSPAFDPHSPQRVLAGPSWLFGVQRGEGPDRHVVLVSVSDRDRAVRLGDLGVGGRWRDRLGSPGTTPYGPDDVLVLPPWGVAWLALDED